MTGPGALSVVMPLYNKRDYVRASVMSVLAQTFTDFELIVVDDGSTDGGAAALADIDDPRLSVIAQANAGVALARNRGIAAARHPWVALLDADDLWTPDHLAEIAAIIAARPDAGMVSTGIQLVRNAADVRSPPPRPVTVAEIDYLAAATRDVHVVTSSSVALRKAAVLEIGGFRDYRPGEDIDCWVRLALDRPVVHSSRVTAFYLRNTGGAMDGWMTPKRGAKIRQIDSLAAFGGTVRTLHEALATGGYEHRRRSAEAYMDARIIANVHKSLTWGDAGGARQRLRFVHDKASRAYRFYRLLSVLPGAVIPPGLAAIRRARRWLRR